MSGAESYPGVITENGFSATWLTYGFTGRLRGSKRVASMFRIDVEPPEPRYQNNLDYIREKYLQGYRWGALLRPFAPEDAVVNQSEAGRTHVAVCATNGNFITEKRENVDRKGDFRTEKKICWTWRGVYEWDQAEPLPAFSKFKNIDLV